MLARLDLVLNLYAAIEFRPQIAGVLTVLVSVLVLCGSVWLLLSTNSGIRLGTLISLTGFFGWMFIMGITWWIYGIGYFGAMPTWVPNDINRGDLGASSLEAAHVLSEVEKLDGEGFAYQLVLDGDNEEASREYNRTLNLVDSIEIDDIVLSDTVASMFGQGTLFENLSLEDQTNAQERAKEATLAALSDSDRAELEADFAEFVADRQLRNETVTLSELAAVAPTLTDEANFVPGDWRLVSSAGAGEAQAAAAAALVEAGLFASPAEFKFLDTYARGGKPKRASNGMWDRVTNKIGNTLRIRHPEPNTVVRVQKVLEQTPAPGEAPPRPVVDSSTDVVNVIMTRDLGNRRFPPAMTTIGSLIIFLVLCYLLHVRDIDAMQRRAEFEANPDKYKKAKASV